jgi:hypothetical protein
MEFPITPHLVPVALSTEPHDRPSLVTTPEVRELLLPLASAPQYRMLRRRSRDSQNLDGACGGRVLLAARPQGRLTETDIGY